MACLEKITQPFMVPEQVNEEEDQVINTAAEIATLKHLKHWTQKNPQAVLNEINCIHQYHDDTVVSYNKLVDELQELENNYEKQTDDLIETQSQLDQSCKQVWVLKIDNAAKTTHL